MAIAHGFAPRIRIENNATTDKELFGVALGVYAPDSPSTNAANDVDLMPFGIYLGDKHPEVKLGLDVIARYTDQPDYSAITRQGNTVLIGLNSHIEDWSEGFQKIVGQLGPALQSQPPFDPADVAAEANGNYQLWEYETLRNVSVTRQILNDYGKKGWEICGFNTDADGSNTVVFKRPKR